MVECEGEVGKSMVSIGDDFTVQTSLEDLEFGFSIIQSTQKVCLILSDSHYSQKERLVTRAIISYSGKVLYITIILSFNYVH